MRFGSNVLRYFVAVSLLGDAALVQANSFVQTTNCATDCTKNACPAECTCMGDEGTRFGKVTNPNDYTCNANDVSLASLTLTEVQDSEGNTIHEPYSCTEGEDIKIRFTAGLENTASSSRSDVGVWVSTDGDNAKSGQCTHFFFDDPNPGSGSKSDDSTPPILDNIDDSPKDRCGDLGKKQEESGFEVTETLSGTVNPLIDVKCVNDGSSKLQISYCMGYKVPGKDEKCDDFDKDGDSTMNEIIPGTLPATTSKCTCGTVSIDVTVNPEPSPSPSSAPSTSPSSKPSSSPSRGPSSSPSNAPSTSPSSKPSLSPSNAPSLSPSNAPSASPSSKPSSSPSGKPSMSPSSKPSSSPSEKPSTSPSEKPSTSPSGKPSFKPSSQPSSSPSGAPSASPSEKPSSSPSTMPSTSPSGKPSSTPSSKPSLSPSSAPSESPSRKPSSSPSSKPSFRPSGQPSSSPSDKPSSTPSDKPSFRPSSQPSTFPSNNPSPPPSSIDAPIDIKFCSSPNGFNCKSKGNGVLPMTVFGTNRLDVTEIDLRTIQLCKEDGAACIDISNVRSYGLEDRGNPKTDLGASKCTSNDGDGKLDLEIKWEKRAIIFDLLDKCKSLSKKDNSPTLIFVAMTNRGEEVKSTPIGHNGIDQLYIQNK